MTTQKPPCEDTACKSKSDAMRKMFAKGGGGGGGGSGAAKKDAATAPCPPDREELGRHSWTLVRASTHLSSPARADADPCALLHVQMHTLCAYYPDEPSTAQRVAALAFINAIGVLYPCSHCREDFRAGLEENPPRAASREQLSVWMCEAHNRVNRLLGKTEFPCTLSQLDARWRKGGAHCDEGLAED